ncbi:MAG: hypothetical protein QOH08_612, partial [Chloroflexota bacterium]|nr:hypothetical protein [Chloroflexota bacterium]
ALALNAFVYEAVPPLTLKGKARPVPAYRVVGPERRSAPRGGATLVGRGAELARLFELYRRAAGGQGEAVHLSGEAGVGKSRVLAEFLAGVPGTTSRVRARCSSYETATPYALVADLLRRIMRIAATADAATARTQLEVSLAALALPLEEGAASLVLEVLGYDERSVLDPERKRGLLAVVLRQLLVQRAAGETVVVACEDLHWIDQASASLLGDLAKDVAGQRVLLLTTGRGVDDAPWQAIRIDLEPFDAQRAGELIDHVATAPLDERARALILERAGGNPFFIEEVVRSLASGHTTVPATVQELLQARFDALDGTPRRVAQRASVIGRSFWLRVLARVTPGDPLETSLVTLEEQGFIEPREKSPEPTYAFHHALVQEVIYGSQLGSQRRVAHGSVGVAIEELYAERAEEFTDTLAFHYDRSDNDEKALVWLVRAGDRAKSLFANDDATKAFTSALRRSRDGTGSLDASAILERIGEVSSLTGKYDAAIESFRAALERGGALSDDSAARCHRKIGMTLVLKGAFAEALESYSTGLGAAGHSATLETARITAQIGQLQWRRGDYAAARDALTKAVDEATALGADDVLADGLKQLGNISLFAGDPRDAELQYQRSRAISERREDLPAIAGVRLNLGDAYCRLGQWDAALGEFAAALALYQRIGDPWCIALIHNNVGEVERIKGNVAEAVPAFERSVAISRSTGDAAGLALALTGLGAAHADAGEPERGRDELLEAERLFATVGSTTYLPDLYRFLASAELALAELEPAARAAERSLEFARAAKVRHQEAMTLRVAGEIALARGDRESARALLAESKTTLLALGENAELARTEAALARLGAEV